MLYAGILAAPGAVVARASASAGEPAAPADRGEVEAEFLAQDQHPLIVCVGGVVAAFAGPAGTRGVVGVQHAVSPGRDVGAAARARA